MRKTQKPSRAFKCKFTHSEVHILNFLAKEKVASIERWLREYGWSANPEKIEEFTILKATLESAAQMLSSCITPQALVAEFRRRDNA